MKRATVRKAGLVIGWAITAALIAAVFRNPDGPWERWLMAVALASTMVGTIYDWLNPAKPMRFESDAARAQHRERMRQLLQGEIYRRRAEGLRQDMIVRDLSRMDNYPQLTHEKGISPWFRIGLVDTYDKGTLVGLRTGGLKECAAGYRCVDWVNDEESDHIVNLLGDIPYDSIASVNLDGDEYYSFVHIYCHFDHAGQPYSRLWFGRRVEIDQHWGYYEHIADYEEVMRNNPIDGNLHFG